MWTLKSDPYGNERNVEWVGGSQALLATASHAALRTTMFHRPPAITTFGLCALHLHLLPQHLISSHLVGGQNMFFVVPDSRSRHCSTLNPEREAGPK